jgi:hypothetical protein
MTREEKKVAVTANGEMCKHHIQTKLVKVVGGGLKGVNGGCPTLYSGRPFRWHCSESRAFNLRDVNSSTSPSRWPSGARIGEG